MKLEKILFNQTKASDWNSLIKNFDVTANYTFWQLNYLTILNESIKNLSYILRYKNNVIAVVPLFIEKNNCRFQFATGDEPIFSPVLKKNITKKEFSDYLSFILDDIEFLAKKYNCHLARFQFSPLIQNHIDKKLYIDRGYHERILYPDWYIFKCDKGLIINLNKSEKEIFKSIRKGNRANIKSTEKSVEIKILDKDNFSSDDFKEYIDLYVSEKGNKRSIKAFNFDILGIKEGLEIIFLCFKDGVLIGAIAIYQYEEKARLNSIVKRSKIKKIYPIHFLIWSAIKHLKCSGISDFEIGEKLIEDPEVSISEKERNLAHFKSGWGANSTPWLKLEKFFKS